MSLRGRAACAPRPELTGKLTDCAALALHEAVDRDDGIQGRTQQRKFSRRPVRLPARLRVGSVEMSAVLENISPGGAFLAVALPECDELIASIDLPQGRHVHVRATVRWRREEPPGVGVEFDHFIEPYTLARSAT